jgi:hypothetical protein
MVDTINNSDSGKWENKTEADLLKDKYRFNGERYSLKGTAHELGDDIIPEAKGLYPFPKIDTIS